MQSLLLSQVIEDKLRMATAIMVRTTEKEDLLLSIHASQTPQSWREDHLRNVKFSSESHAAWIDS